MFHQIRHNFTDGVYIKQIRLTAGEVVEKHAHTYDHFSGVIFGVVDVEIDGKKRRHFAGDLLTIKAKQQHRITAVTNAEWWCIHATDEKDPSRVDEVLIKKGE